MAKAELEYGVKSAEFCYAGYTTRSFTDSSDCYRGVHTPTGKEVYAKTREGAVKAIATVERKQIKIKEAVNFLKAEGFQMFKSAELLFPRTATVPPPKRIVTGKGLAGGQDFFEWRDEERAKKKKELEENRANKKKATA
jgi:hypothetical protein